MSLLTDKVFYNALKANAQLVYKVGGRIYSTAIPVPDEELDNEPIPYIIITYDGMSNEGWSKDNSYEGENDRVTIGITVVADNREALGELTVDIRHQVEEYFLGIDEEDEDYSLVPDSYQLTASEISYDSMKPCFYQSMQYVCDTNRD